MHEKKQLFNSSNRGLGSKKQIHKIIGQTLLYRWLKIFIFILMLGQTNCDVTVYATPANSAVQTITSYTFLLQISAVGLVPKDSIIQIDFPIQYQSIPTTTVYSCQSTSWVIPLTLDIACSIQYRKLTITNGFPNSYSFDLYSQILQFKIANIKNPSYVLTADPFYGRFKSAADSYTYQFSLYSPNTYITAGNINVVFALDPDMANTEAALTITLTPQHTIPINSSLTIILDPFWDKSVRNISKIMSSGVSCNNIPSSGLSNILCSFFDIGSNLKLEVQNVFQSNISPFSLLISPFLSPSSTQPQGNLNFQIYYTVNGQKRIIDQSSSNKITCGSALSILNPSLTLTTKKVNTLAQLAIKVTFNSFISSTKDTFYIGLPKQIGLSNLTSVTVGAQLATSLTTNTTGTSQNLVIFKGVGLNAAQIVTITLKNILNPPYVLKMGSLTLYTSRNSYKIDQLYDNTNIYYSTQPGSLSVSLSTTNQMVGVQNVEYQFTISSDTPMYTSTILQITFFDTVQIQNQAIGCKNVCTVTKTNNVATFLSAIKNNNITSAIVTITGVKNIYELGLTSSMTVRTYTDISGTPYLVDQAVTGIVMQTVTRQLSGSDVTISSSNIKVNEITNLTMTINNKNPIPENSNLQIIVPTELTLPVPSSCSPYCTLIAVNTLSISFTDATTTLPPIVLFNIRNPTSLMPTSTFQIKVINSELQTLSNLLSGVTYKATQVAECNFLLTRSSTQNYAQNVQYNFTIRVNFNLGGKVAIILGLPIQCASCTIHSTTTSTYYYLISNKDVNAEQNGNYAVFITIDGLKNWASLSPQFYSAAIYTNSQIYQIAYKDIQVTNQYPGVMTYSSASFSSKELNTQTSLTIVGISTPTILSYLIFEFGLDINIISSTCNSQYSCDITDNKIKVTPISNFGPGTLTTLIIQNLITSTLTPSQGITIKSYTSTNYIIAQSAQFTWQTNCTVPCKTCQLTPFSGTTCLSCYSDSLLLQVQAKILLFNSQCVSICGDKYYKDQVSNICQKCSTQCNNCIKYSSCLSCNSGQYLLQSNYTCYQICPEGYFQYDLTSTTRVCQACTPSLNCKSCSNAISCNSCPDGYYYYLLKCLLVCPASTTIQNSYTNKCDTCPTNCTSCQLKDISVYCLTCQNGYLLDNGGCYQTCRTPNTVSNGDLCEGCSTQCRTCSLSIDNCLTCYTSSQYKYFFSNRCLENCPDGYYPFDELFTCLKCTSPCQYCVNSSVTSCITCITGFSLHGSTCQSDCPSGFYKNGSSICTACINNCLTCQSDTLCMTCLENYYLKGSLGPCISSCGDGYIPLLGKCESCSSNCKTCSAINYCSTCPANTYLLNGSCMNPCTIGYYKHDANLTCLVCLFSCSACENSTYCTDCQSGYELTVSFTCQSTCQTGYVPISGVCTICNSNCTSCIETVNKCTKCITDYYLVQSTFACYSSCPIVYYIYQQNKTCLVSCPSKFFGSINSATQIKTCVSCPSLCLVCTSSTICSSCNYGALMLTSQQKCYETCPQSAPYNISNYCKTCNVISCFLCQGESCIQCQSQFLLIGGQSCISSCGDNQAYSSESKQCIANGSSTSSTITNSSNMEINFIPMPYLILGIVVVIIILAIHCAYSIGIIGGLIGLIASLLFLAIFTSMIIGLVQQDSNLKILGFLLLVAFLINVLLNCVGMFLFCYWKVFPNPAQNTSRIPVVILVTLSLAISYKLLALFCINPKWDHDESPQQSQFNCISLWKQLNFLPKFNLLCKISIFVLLAQIVFAVFMCFLPSFSNYLFYGGIEIIVLAIAEIILTVMWIAGVRGQGKKSSNLRDYQVQESSEKIEKLDNNNDYQVQKKSEELSFNQTQPLRIEQNSNLALSRGYHSNYTKMKDTVKISNENMKQAFQKGVFRKNQKTLLQQRQQNDNLTQLQSASKMNRLLQKEQQQLNYKPSIKSFRKIIPIPITDGQVTPKQQEQQQQENSQEIETNQQPDIIFEALDEQIETHPDEDNNNQLSIIQGSLGSQQGSNKHLLKSSQSRQEERKQIVIEDYSIDDEPDEYINVFDNDYHIEKAKKAKHENMGSLLGSQKNENFEKKQSNISPVILDIQQDEQPSKFESIILDSKITRYKKQPTINQKQIIHADLQSIGTVELEEEEDNQWVDYEKVEKRDNQYIFDIEQDMQKPSEMLRTKFDYKPKQKPVNSPKKKKK